MKLIDIPAVSWLKMKMCYSNRGQLGLPPFKDWWAYFKTGHPHDQKMKLIIDHCHLKPPKLCVLGLPREKIHYVPCVAVSNLSCGSLQRNR